MLTARRTLAAASNHIVAIKAGNRALTRRQDKFATAMLRLY
jgi:hypothetical protein